MWTTQTINNRTTHILHTGNTGPVFVWPFFPHRGDELDHMEDLLNSMLPDFGLTVIACEVKDWNLELSPWKGVSIDGSILGGGGSGSFWVDGWSDYAGAHALRKKTSIYLSLGGKEDKTVCLMAGGIFYACVAQMVEHPTFNIIGKKSPSSTGGG